MNRENILYIWILYLLCSFTLTKVLGNTIGYVFFFAPFGVRSFLLALTVMGLTFILYLSSDKQEEIKEKLWFVSKFWIPFLLYIIIRSELHPVGLFKLAGFLMKVFFPSLIVTVLWVNNSSLFERHLIGVLLFINILAAIGTPFLPEDEEQLYDISIWLSRGIGISVFFLVCNIQLNWKIIIVLPVAIALFGIQIYIGSRGPVASLLAVIIAYYMLQYKRRIISIPVVLYFLTFIIIASLTVPFLREKISGFLTHDHRNQMQVEDFAEDRIISYRIFDEVMKDNPIFGAGFGNWSVGVAGVVISKNAHSRFNVKKLWAKMFSWDYYYYPHNLLLEIIAELGFFGLLLFIFIFYPVKHLFDFFNIYNYAALLGLLYAMTSDDITGCVTLTLFSTLSLLTTLDPEVSPSDLPESTEQGI